MTIRKLLVVDSSVSDQVLGVMQSESTPFQAHVEELDVPEPAPYAPVIVAIPTTVFTGVQQTLFAALEPWPSLSARAYVRIEWLLDWHNSAGFDRAPMAGTLGLAINGGVPLLLGQQQWHPTGPGIVGGDVRSGNMVIEMNPGWNLTATVLGNNNAPYAPNAGQIVAGPTSADAVSKFTISFAGYV